MVGAGGRGGGEGGWGVSHGHKLQINKTQITKSLF